MTSTFASMFVRRIQRRSALCQAVALVSPEVHETSHQSPDYVFTDAR
jgi:hypothetical protein